MYLYDLLDDPKKSPSYEKAERSPILVWRKYKNNPKELKKREDVLAKHPEVAYRYAEEILGHRFPEGEPAIATSPKFAFWYADYVLNGRFPEGEDAIATNPVYAAIYARDMIEGPWPEAEKTIMQHQEAWRKYIKFLNDRGYLDESI